VIRIKNHRKKLNSYNPNLGFIGTVKVDVSNYIFSSKRKRAPYIHSRALVKNLLSREVADHLKESKNLTKFIRKRDLTFQKSDAQGNYKIFTVPCTTTIVPLQKSMFNTIEKAAQSLIVSLRAVIQDIYGSKSIKDSGFVKSLPTEMRNIFIQAIKESPNYFPQLHHPNMKKYPFFDNVGLDLVLIEDYLDQSKGFEDLLKNRKFEKIPQLPFRILELNAGAPSGASNNMNVLEGHYEQNPEVLDSLGKIMPNDHFKVLAETYKSLGEDWTGITDGIQVILPPGGLNGAAPEIHNLAAYSGLVYADPVQLFQDELGYIRLRTINGSNPKVTAIYSRINADSALFDIDKGIILRDPDTNEPIYLRDSLKLGKEGEAPLVLDLNGNPIPLQSDYAVPGLLEAILNKKIYMGGLNRILDNKIILATLTTYAPKYFAPKLKELGLTSGGAKIIPPETLPPKKESVKIIEKNPEEWVVKAPNLSGGSGIYILKTLSAESKKEVLEMIRKNPTHYAYQKLVKIARIPVAMKDKQGTRFANLAADIRLWVFYGGGAKALPKMTHNALVRYAPEEKGPMSSIVNTSKGGGYAPFVVVDDVGVPQSVSASEFIKPLNPVPLKTHLPMFVAAQLIQVSRLASEIHQHLKNGTGDSYVLEGLALSLKTQCREVLSFLNPRSIEPVYKLIDLLESKQAKAEIATYFDVINSNQIQLVRLLQKLESSRKLPLSFRLKMDELLILDQEIVYQNYNESNRTHDRKILRELRKIVKEKAGENKELQRQFNQLIQILRSSIEAKFSREIIQGKAALNMLKLIEQFMKTVKERLQNSEKAIEFAKLFALNVKHPDLKFETFGLTDENSRILTASQKEFTTGELITESNYIPDHIKAARADWLQIEDLASKIPKNRRNDFLQNARIAHFKKHPFLERMTQIINSKKASINDMIELLPVMPYAKFNLEQFAKKQGLSLEEIFTNKLTPNKISILSSKQIRESHLSAQDHAGECFAKKRKSHGLFSDSDIFIWIRKELDPLTQIYTAGHEIIHYHQIESTTRKEAKALSDGAIAQAYFLNFYGNFLGISAASLEGLSVDISVERQPLYGLADRIVPYFFSPLITEIRRGINGSSELYNETLDKYGSLFGYMMPNSNQVKVKALQEIIPALENAKNIKFAKELGLDISWDEVKSALPSANNFQLKTFGPRIQRAIKKAKPDYEALTAIGNHQFYGVSFARKEMIEKSISLSPVLSTISLGSSYNQTQQQQQQ
jgi:uncharacterized circularly permuted ATP-grasp superfamily protein